MISKKIEKAYFNVRKNKVPKSLQTMEKLISRYALEKKTIEFSILI